MADPTALRPIPGFPGYSITPYGDIYSTRVGRWLKRWSDRHGYPTNYLMRPDGKRVSVPIHRAILITFVGPRPSPKHVGRHLNGDRTQSTLDNLAWGTYAENIADAIEHGSAPQYRRRGEEVSGAKITEAQAREIEERARAGGEFLRVIGADYGVTSWQVRLIRDHRVWRHLWQDDVPA